MKKPMILPAVAFLCLTSTLAFAEIAQPDVLKDPAIHAILDAHPSCVVPVDAVHWTCTGTFRPVAKPAMEPSSCFFQISVPCSDGTLLRIDGQKLWYTLVMPDDSVAQTTDPVLVISSVEFAG